MNNKYTAIYIYNKTKKKQQQKECFDGILKCILTCIVRCLRGDTSGSFDAEVKNKYSNEIPEVSDNQTELNKKVAVHRKPGF